MGLIERAKDSVVVENEGGKRLTKSNFVNDGKSRELSNPKTPISK